MTFALAVIGAVAVVVTLSTLLLAGIEWGGEEGGRDEAIQEKQTKDS